LTLLPRLAAVIGADGVIGGFTAMLDWRAPARPAPKDRDFALGLGPLVVTPDELDPEGLAASVRVDGGERLRGRFTGFAWEAARALAAAGTSLRPGDLLAGPCLAEVAEIGPGAMVELEVEGIGVLAQAVEG
jgi:2-keto-4-pentenoate hydratase/2-oxohepta-3-ene-1,7-dioic acid hydratase in catechol pathway